MAIQRHFFNKEAMSKEMNALLDICYGQTDQNLPYAMLAIMLYDLFEYKLMADFKGQFYEKMKKPNVYENISIKLTSPITGFIPGWHLETEITYLQDEAFAKAVILYSLHNGLVEVGKALLGRLHYNLQTI